MHIIKAVADLGRQMGIDLLKLNPDGVCTLNIGDTDSLFLERRGRGSRHKPRKKGGQGSDLLP